MRMKINKSLYWSSFVFLLILFCVMLYFSKGTKQKSKDSIDFWNQIGIQKDTVDLVKLVYKEQEVVLDEESAKNFLDVLTTLKEKKVDDNHEFTASDITAIFMIEGKEYEVTFFWFPYMRTLQEGISFSTGGSGKGLPQIIGDRVDIIVNDKLFHFSFSTDTVWTEDIIRQMYDLCAEQQGKYKLHQLDGGDDGEIILSPMLDEIPSIETVLENSEIIFTGSYVNSTYNGYNVSDYFYQDYAHIKSVEIFQIDDVLKGKVDGDFYSLFSDHTVNDVNIQKDFQKTTIVYESVYNPSYQIGEKYLICIDLDQDDIYQTHCQYGTAVLDGETLFPRFNTEDHPFYNININYVKECLAKFV